MERFSIKKRLKSFTYAFDGLVTLIKEEHNARIHLVAMLCVIAAGFLFRISPFEWMAVAFAIGIVFGSEAFNSAIERLSDKVCPEHDKLIKKVKDLSAAAVLIAAITALAIGIIIFAPKTVSFVCHL